MRNLAQLTASIILAAGVAAAHAQGHDHGASSGAQAPMPGMASTPANASPATKAYMDAMDKMHGPMTEGAQASDADVAFVKGMIAHHQGAIDMAKVRLQYGKDPQTKKWADDVIREQAREIDEMQAWLKKNGN